MISILSKLFQAHVDARGTLDHAKGQLLTAAQRFQIAAERSTNADILYGEAMVRECSCDEADIEGAHTAAQARIIYEVIKAALPYI